MIFFYGFFNKRNNELDDSLLERTRVPWLVEGVRRSFIDEGPPEGGDEGGQVIFCGTPESLAENKKSYTGQFLKDVL